MKTNIKLLILVFILGILGAGVGTFGVLSFFDVKSYINDKLKKDDNVIINEVKYTEIAKTEYTLTIEKAYDSVVEITCNVVQNTFFGTQEGVSSGSGVIFTSDGYIVTNNHVIEGASGDDAIEVKLSNNETYKAKLIGTDARTDIAVLKIEANNLSYSSFADSEQLLLGQDVIAIGNPLGLGISCTNGIISALEKEIYINNVYMNVIQTNAAVNAGNSGGGLFDINGNLVGIVNAKSNSQDETTVEGMGYAIPSNRVISIVNELIENGYVKHRAALGIKVAAAGSNANGVLVSEVIPGGGAEKAGIHANDYIIKVNDIDVTSYAEMTRILDTKAIGDTIKVTVNRNGEQLDFKVTLEASSNN